MSNRAGWIVVGWMLGSACSGPAPAATGPARPASPGAPSDAPAVTVTAPPDAAPTPRPAPTRFEVVRPTWAATQTLAVKRTTSVRADGRELGGPPTSVSIALSGVAPLASTSATGAARDELPRIEALLGAAVGTRELSQELPALAAAVAAAFPELTLAVRSVQYMGTTSDGASFAVESAVTGKVGGAATIVDTTLLGELLVSSHGLALQLVGPGKVEIRAGLGGTTTSAVIRLELDAR